MKNEKPIEQDDGLELCDECGNNVPKEEIKTCPDCFMKICEDCWKLHSETHFEEEET